MLKATGLTLLIKHSIVISVYMPHMLQTSTAVVEPFNTILHTARTMDHTDVSFMLDNQALFNICEKKLGVEWPVYTNLNRLIAQAVSSITASMRFGGWPNYGLAELQMNLVPFPRLHFPVINYGPLLGADKAQHERSKLEDLTNACFECENQMLQCDMTQGKYMAICMMYRGDVTPSNVNDSIRKRKAKMVGRFVDWCPCGYKASFFFCCKTRC